MHRSRLAPVNLGSVRCGAQRTWPHMSMMWTSNVWQVVPAGVLGLPQVCTPGARCRGNKMEEHRKGRVGHTDAASARRQTVNCCEVGYNHAASSAPLIAAWQLAQWPDPALTLHTPLWSWGRGGASPRRHDTWVCLSVLVGELKVLDLVSFPMGEHRFPQHSSPTLGYHHGNQLKGTHRSLPAMKVGRCCANLCCMCGLNAGVSILYSEDMSVQ
jgi:hypothetical protein